MKNRAKNLRNPLQGFLGVMAALMALFLTQCSGGLSGGPSGAVDSGAAANVEANQGQATPTHFGGVDNPAPDWTGCGDMVDENGNPLTPEECLKRLKEKRDQYEKAAAGEDLPIPTPTSDVEESNPVLKLPK
ncbi:MAG: hypothetical protein K8R69_11360 [Deltaproteobacteria bacterium]|nr:hypothetical protein [Deltaproteobacteria bacterium]